MKKLILLSTLTLGLQAKADLFRLNLSIADKCKEQASTVLIKTELSLPAELSFLIQNRRSALIPRAIEVKTKEGLNMTGAIGNDVRLATETAQYFSAYSPVKTEIYIEAPKEILCDPNSVVSFIYDLTNEKEQNFGKVKYTLSTQENLGLLPNETRLQVLNEINFYYLEKLIYFLSDDFLWSKDSNDLTLVDFFSSIEPKYLLTKKEVESVLINPKYNAEVKSGFLVLHFGERQLQLGFQHDYYHSYFTAGKSQNLLY